ncbi:RDD family protein [uncultured Paraglaciecola sp.]|uniref:RDD family protein n=1 Tax=uncultured Paraglaciecola sp. TaxID=1765024 RepID=UPI002595E7AF|nr:RDD family protein [uncultured Paraglaciecola sp.]
MENNNRVLDSSEPQVTNNVKQSTASHSKKETREIVTPYAFFVADDLLGTRLASPVKRGIALSIDLFLVTLLTQVSSLILAIVAAATFFRAGNRLKTKKRFNMVRIFLRFLVTILLFFIALAVFDDVSDTVDTDKSGEAIKGIEVSALTAKYLIQVRSVNNKIDNNQCTPVYNCWLTLGQLLVEDVDQLNLSAEDRQGILEVFADLTVSEHMTEAQAQQLLEELKTQPAKEIALSESESIEPLLAETSKNNLDQVINTDTPNTPPGLIAWAQTIAEDLGLGFGWAAFYFSIFTAWWNGQTPGKKVVGIKVLQLDGSGLNLWESFGRYGGYGAGLATGLLGFLQIFWDPNRQAIQDKISETLVIDLRYPKVTLGTSENQQE